MSLRSLSFAFALLVPVLGFGGSARGDDVRGSEAREVEELKRQIVELAESFSGQGDPDFTRQRALEPLVERLLALAPQPPVAERLPLLYGAWKQVWGPYDYRNDDRGVDPTLGTDEIYQVVSPDGFYYNVSPIFQDGDLTRERIGLLRGAYVLSDSADNELDVRFTNYPGVDPRPTDIPLWELPELAESGRLENRVTIVPTWIVRVFFGGGSLEEVYTDGSLRILYGKNRTRFEDKYIYVMTKM